MRFRVALLLPGWRSFFKRRLGFDILPGMIGARLQPGQPERVQPLAHRAEVNPGVVTPRRFLLQVHAAPAHHTMQCRIGSRDHQRCQWSGASKTDLRTASETTLVTVCELSHKEIRDYVATGEPMDKAGFYRRKPQSAQTKLQALPCVTLCPLC